MSIFDSMLQSFSRFMFFHCSLSLETSDWKLFGGIPGRQFYLPDGRRLKQNEDSTVADIFNER